MSNSTSAPNPSSNMAVEDLLDELGGYGIGDLRKGKFTKAGSPHLRGKPEEWKLTLRLPGYHNVYGPHYIVVAGATIRDVAEDAYTEFENYFFSPQADEDRTRYESEHAMATKRYENASSAERVSGFNPVRKPDDLIPPIVWGEARGGFVC